MKKTRAQNTNKGITLIALVITIIVMLILVAVTITMAVNGGLFNYAGKAATQTNEAIDKEQELANLEANMTVDELIEKYSGSIDKTPVDLSVLNIGDYVNYPVNYINVATECNSSTGEEIGGCPKDEFTGWRVLSKETDEQGNILYIKLISAGIPLNFEGSAGGPPGSMAAVEALTTNFLTTEITSTVTKNKFYKCGFTNVTGTTLENTFANKFTDKVQALTREELEKSVADLGGSATETNVFDSKYKDLFAIPVKETESSGFAGYFLATGAGGSHGDNGLYYVNKGVVSSGSGTSGINGLRVVVFLSSDVQFTASANKINKTTTWDISI